jgi:phosphoglycolate phosphatase
VSRPEYKLLIFDWDGTLAIPLVGLSRRCSGLAAPFGLSVMKAVKGIIGLGLPEAILTFTRTWLTRGGCLSSALRRSLYRPGCPSLRRLFAGVADSRLRHSVLQGYRLAVATGKARRGLDRVLKAQWLGATFSTSPALQTKPPASPIP